MYRTIFFLFDEYRNGDRILFKLHFTEFECGYLRKCSGLCRILIPRYDVCIDFLYGVYDVSRGSIEINGVDIRKYNLESLRTQIGYVAQKAHMFKGSIRSNICFGKPEASVEEMVHAATVAQASNFISTREHGYEDEIAEDGTNISGGQKQRLSIARVILKKPSLYIYDDSFSALDFKTDATLRKALKPEVKNAIFFVVAQRISTIMDSDMIIVLDEGQIIGMGTHAQLLKDCSVYQEIAHSQLTQKELDDYERN